MEENSSFPNGSAANENASNQQSQPLSKPNFPARIWLMALTALYAVSFFSALLIISRKETPRIKAEDESLSSPLSKKDYVGIVPIYGVIYQDSSSSFVEKGSQLISTRIKKMAEDKKVKAIVLDINSPGGSVGAVQEIYSTIMKARKETKKPFVARFGEVSASGGYYIAAACDKIIAHPGTITGSIGVIFSVSNIEGLFKKIGVRSEPIKSGKFKDIGSMTREMSKEEKDLLQAMISDSYEAFLNAVSQGRNMDREKLKDLADGRIFTGNQALKVGLIDKLGDLQDAIDEAGIMANLGKNPPIIKNKRYSFDDVIGILDSKLSLFPAASSIPATPALEYRWAGF